MIICLILIIFLISILAISMLNHLLVKSNVNKEKIWKYMFFVQVSNTIIMLFIVWCFFLYPGFYSLTTVYNTDLKKGVIPEFTISHFIKTSNRFAKWANRYIDSQRASKINLEHVAATEWPIFGSVYYLLTAEEIYKTLQNQSDHNSKRQAQAILKASEAAAQIIADPRTGTWVKNKWGDSYLSRENVFYRMLLIMGLSSYEKISYNKQYRDILETQVVTLGKELTEAKTHLRDDYPGECYPNDVLWAVAAILRADKLLQTDHAQLKEGLMQTLDSVSLTKEGVPAYAVNALDGRPVTVARGCSNSGILNFAPELDINIARKWYSNYVKYFWKENRFLAGFREFTSDFPSPGQDVDAGPIIAGYGTVASIFGIGAARGVGNLNHAVQVTLETIVLSWPTPFGFILPNIMAHIGTGAAPLGDTAILFQMTRPILSESRIAYNNPIPLAVWVMILIYFGTALSICYLEYCEWKKLFKRKPNLVKLPHRGNTKL